MKNKKLIISPVQSPEKYYESKEFSLDERLSKISLSNDENDKINTEHSKKFVRDKVLGFFKVGEIISEIINWNEAVDEDVKKAKKEYLLSVYFNKNEKNEKSIESLKYFLTNPVGNTLYNKIVRILDDTPPDVRLSEHLACALNYIVKNNFKDLFEEHKYALSQIEILTPQALSILSDYEKFPIINLGGQQTSSRGKLTSDWLSEFTQEYVNSKSIKDEKITNRIKHSIHELISSRLIEAHLFEENKAKCVVTDLGSDLILYITTNEA